MGKERGGGGRGDVQVVRTRVRRVPKKRVPKILCRSFGSVTCGKQRRWGFLEDLWSFSGLGSRSLGEVNSRLRAFVVCMVRRCTDACRGLSGRQSCDC